MVRTPKELADLLTEKRNEELVRRSAQVVKAEKSIEDALVAANLETTSWPVRIDAEKIGYGLVREAVIERYRAAGWLINEYADSGDWGDTGYHYYHFRPKDLKM